MLCLSRQHALRFLPTAIAIASLVGLGGNNATVAEDAPMPARMSMKGMTAIVLVVTNTKEDLGKIGLSEGMVRTAIELRLRRAGIPVVDEYQLGAGFLNASVKSVTDGDVVACSANISLMQLVVADINKIECLGDTYSKSGLTLKTRDGIAKSVIGLFEGGADVFANDYLAVNPK